MRAAKPDGSCSPSFFPMNSNTLTIWIGTMLGKVSNSCRYYKWLGKTTGRLDEIQCGWGFGILVRDPSGHFVKGLSGSLGDGMEAKLIKIMSIREALSWLHEPIARRLSMLLLN
ncbi:hypothetical protein ES332_D11G212200v1 [Gossypium tomentosum]|uniref:RNase H type-1 domain-containing protein n=1 Tax=Gossypium tomentosum TaxID=34277 RepID=A0A5D2IRP2_GOSTO|nr:hypothetical protein ES332_D11G212200v1 [Gossypium tomentosum]